MRRDLKAVGGKGFFSEDKPRASNTNALSSYTELGARSTGGDGGGEGMEQRIINAENNINHLKDDVKEINKKSDRLTENISTSTITLQSSIFKHTLTTIGLVISAVGIAAGLIIGHTSSRFDILNESYHKVDKQILVLSSDIKTILDKTNVIESKLNNNSSPNKD